MIEWAAYYWQRLQNRQIIPGLPPWGPEALAIAGLLIFVIFVARIVIPLLRELGALIAGGAEWVTGTAAFGIVFRPVHAYLQTHSSGLPVSAETVWWTWWAFGIVLLVLATFSGAHAARIGWLLYGAAATAMVYQGTAEPARQVAAGIAVLWWLGFSLPALRRKRMPSTVIAYVPELLSDRLNDQR
ncbi:hypothetical protein ADL15_07065 [Actinoplanes awajinensis subsp. mycoplanecinus]|uniref:Uncharacterized protein n=1 Tax=Actinoplanes awajinensis subsp. mycoplanecinus TaxID=135947 RepID=A0A0X3V7G1_9ACTN|nr:hypothetical protein ADL15_07065 [Actinoplanes awajinensis subsp. mycoplanecinus]